MEETKNFRTEPVPPGSCGSCAKGGGPVHWEAPSQVGLSGELENLSCCGRAGTQRAENRESCTSQPISSSQTMTPTRWQAWRTQKSTQKPHSAERGAHKPRNTEDELRVLREIHTSLHNTEGRAGELRKDPHKAPP